MGYTLGGRAAEFRELFGRDPAPPYGYGWKRFVSGCSRSTGPSSASGRPDSHRTWRTGPARCGRGNAIAYSGWANDLAGIPRPPFGTRPPLPDPGRPQDRAIETSTAVSVCSSTKGS